MSGIVLFGVSGVRPTPKHENPSVTSSKSEIQQSKNAPSKNITAKPNQTADYNKDNDILLDEDKPVMQRLQEQQSAVLLGRQLSTESTALLNSIVTADKAAVINMAPEKAALLGEQFPILSMDKVIIFKYDGITSKFYPIIPFSFFCQIKWCLFILFQFDINKSHNYT